MPLTADQSLPLRKRLWLLASQAVNAIFFAGDPAESLSSRAWRQRGEPAWDRRRARIDRFLGTDHCMNVYLSQALREMHRAARPNPQGSPR
jgi:hypothetical protein